MPLVKTNLDNLNFAKLYKKQMKNSTFKSKSSDDWDKKAKQFNQNILNSSYTKEFIEKVNTNNCETLLDIGSGPGTICLALANKLKEVYALDYSSLMLELAKENANNLNIKNLKTIHKSWYDDWSDVPKSDIVVASRSMQVENIKKALKKLNSKANKRVYLTTKVGGSFIDKEILKLLKRDVVPRPDYIYLLNTLHSMEIYAKVDFIKTEGKKFDCQNEDEFLNSLKWSLGKISKKEEKILKEYFNTKYKNQIKNESTIWAFISWEIQ